MACSIKWCLECTREECPDRDEFFPLRDHLLHTPLTKEERKKYEDRARNLKKEIRKCLNRRYFMFLKLCKEGKYEDAHRLFLVSCEEAMKSF